MSKKDNIYQYFIYYSPSDIKSTNVLNLSKSLCSLSSFTRGLFDSKSFLNFARFSSFSLVSFSFCSCTRFLN